MSLENLSYPELQQESDRIGQEALQTEDLVAKIGTSKGPNSLDYQNLQQSDQIRAIKGVGRLRNVLINEHLVNLGRTKIEVLGLIQQIPAVVREAEQGVEEIRTGVGSIYTQFELELAERALLEVKGRFQNPVASGVVLEKEIEEEVTKPAILRRPFVHIYSSGRIFINGVLVHLSDDRQRPAFDALVKSAILEERYSVSPSDLSQAAFGLSPADAHLSQIMGEIRSKVNKPDSQPLVVSSGRKGTLSTHGINPEANIVSDQLNEERLRKERISSLVKTIFYRKSPTMEPILTLLIDAKGELVSRDGLVKEFGGSVGSSIYLLREKLAEYQDPGFTYDIKSERVKKDSPGGYRFIETPKEPLVKLTESEAIAEEQSLAKIEAGQLLEEQPIDVEMEEVTPIIEAPTVEKDQYSRLRNLTVEISGQEIPVIDLAQMSAIELVGTGKERFQIQELSGRWGRELRDYISIVEEQGLVGTTGKTGHHSAVDIKNAVRLRLLELMGSNMPQMQRRQLNRLTRYVQSAAIQAEQYPLKKESGK